MFKSFLQHLTRFRRDERGNLMLIVALALPAIGVVGIGSLDTWQFIETRRQMQSATEQAALAALRPDRARWKARKRTAESLYFANLNTPDTVTGQRLRMRAWRDKDTVSVEITAKAQYATIFGKATGGENRELKVTATAERQANVIRIVTNRDEQTSRSSSP